MSLLTCSERGSGHLQISADCVLIVCRKTVHDKQTGSDIVLSEEQVELVNRLQRGQFGDVNFNEYQVCAGDAGDARLPGNTLSKTCLLLPRLPSLRWSSSAPT